MNVAKTALVSCIAIASVGCVVYEDDRRPHDHYYVDDSPPAPAETTPSAPTSTETSSTPMLVDVDTNQTMDAEGGEGVGVFVEYFEGGHWRIWWSCDTHQTGQSCDFALSITAATGSVKNLDATAIEEGGVAKVTSDSRIDVTSSTRTDVRGILFDTDAGATITVMAALGSLVDGSFLFFVQDGKVNGGFEGKVTNPLQLRGTTP